MLPIDGMTGSMTDRAGMLGLVSQQHGMAGMVARPITGQLYAGRDGRAMPLRRQCMGRLMTELKYMSGQYVASHIW